MSADTTGFICVASVAGASFNSTTFWTCEVCGASVLTSSSSYVSDTPLRIHRDWHASLAAAVPLGGV